MANTEQPAIVLASASPRRAELLAALGVTFRVRPADADETVSPVLTPDAAVREIARRKLRAACAASGPGDLVLVADTIVALDGKVLGKPADADAAREMLHALRGRSHEVFTAVSGAWSIQEANDCVRTAVVMRQYSDAEVEASIVAGTPFDKAGSYAIQDAGFQPVERFDGCYCNVMGLPLWAVYGLLKQLAPSLDLAPPDASLERCSTCPLRG